MPFGKGLGKLVKAENQRLMKKYQRKPKLVTTRKLNRVVRDLTDHRMYREDNQISFSSWATTNISFDHVGFGIGDADGQR